MLKVQKESEAFDYGQYWKVKYTEIRSNGERLNFNTVIYSKSKDFALDILKKKTAEDNKGSTIDSVSMDRFCAQTKLRGKKLSILDWEHIRNASFPNEVNILFKKCQ